MSLPSGEPDRIRFRPLQEEDVAAVAALEALSFSTPWKAETFRDLFLRPEVLILVGEEGGELMAYAVVWCMGEEAEVANLAVAEAHRGRGVGGRLLDRVVQQLRARGVRSLYLEVRESNEAARRLYARRGFREAGRRKGYYNDPPEDARVLLLTLEPTMTTLPE